MNRRPRCPDRRALSVQAPGAAFAATLLGALGALGALGLLVMAQGRAVAQDLAPHELTPPPSGGTPLEPGAPAPSATPARGESPAEAETAASSASSASSASGTEPAGGYGAALSDPHLHYPPDAAPPDDQSGALEPWMGPAVELGYTHFRLPDGDTGGAVNAGTFGGYLPTGPVRLGGRAELGSRVYSPGTDDLMVRGAIWGGYQYLGWRPFAPYAAATVSIGVLVGERSDLPRAWGFGGGGAEVGADLVLVRNLWIGLSFAYERVRMDGEGFDLWVFRVRVGL